MKKTCFKKAYDPCAKCGQPAWACGCNYVAPVSYGLYGGYGGELGGRVSTDVGDIYSRCAYNAGNRAYSADGYRGFYNDSNRCAYPAGTVGVCGCPTCLVTPSAPASCCYKPCNGW